jgi:thioredoxin 1
MSKAQAVTDGDFKKEVLESDVPVLVDFWATWCGPCQVMGPVVDTVAGENEGKVKVIKINVDENPETPAQYCVRCIQKLSLQ